MQKAMHRKRGQAMVETIVVLVFLLFAFFALFQFTDNLRAKLLCEYAAGRCARAATAGYNDFMIEKTARIATMAAAGPCRTRDEKGDAYRYQSWISRAPDYLECVYDAQARQILDFEYWRDGRTQVTTTRSGARIETTVTQTRPQFFSLATLFQERVAGEEVDHGDARITGTSSIEAHYPDWLQ